MTRPALALLAIVLLAACSGRREPKYEFRDLAFPGASSTVAAGINDTGHVVGWYRKDGRTIGFILKDADYASIEYPGAAATQVTGVNASGDIVGVYRTAEEDAARSAVAFHGFMRTASLEFMEVRHPDHKYAVAQRILDDGTIYGCYHGDDFTGTMRAIKVPRHAVNRAGVSAAAIEVLDRPATMSNGATPDGSTVVGFDMATGEAYRVERGALATFKVPGSKKTEAWDVNRNGVVVGMFEDAAAVSHGFVQEEGRFATVDFPGAVRTIVFGVNGRGDIVGAYRKEGDEQGRGYIATRR